MHPFRVVVPVVGFAVLLLLVSQLPQRLILHQRANSESCSITIDAKDYKPLTRSWNNYAQGGEEQTPMLLPVLDLVSVLKPAMVRIDHFFDFPNPELRLAEINRLGALPFVSLSYFPNSISSELTKMPKDLGAWTDLVARAAESINKQQGGALVYYEVWNEPDLFGGFDADEYFHLYQATVEGVARCSSCTNYRIGGPAITTLKTAWLDRFLQLVIQNNVRLDFVSWHSYQKNPQKTAAEAAKLVSLPSLQSIGTKPEIIVSEWGITPENSYEHDGYESASHAIAITSLTTGAVDRLFAFELKDGPDPSGKQYWGRWGLITHQNTTSVAKPRYYAFTLLNKLGDFQLKTSTPNSSVYPIASTDASANLALVFSQIGSGCNQVKLHINNLTNGKYLSRLFSLDVAHSPTSSDEKAFDVSQETANIDVNTASNGSYLVTLDRRTAGVFSGQGRTGSTADYSARIGPNTPAITYPIVSSLKVVEQIRLGFWLKEILGNDGANNRYRLIASSTNETDSTLGFTLGIDTVGTVSQLIFEKVVPGNRQEKVVLDLGSLDTGQWHYYQLAFDNTSSTVTLAVDNLNYTSGYQTPWPVIIGSRIGFGDTSTQGINGHLDDLTITIPPKTLYQDNFN